MNKKITCPICGETNNEINKACKNHKCKWDLTFAKDGAFVGLSEDEIEKYNNKLSLTKQQYKDALIQAKKETPLFEEPKIKNLNSLHLTKLIDLKRGNFETIEEYNERILRLGYLQIGNYKLNEYYPDKEYYSITISIDKKDNQLVEYDFDKLDKIFVRKDIARRIGLNKEFPLLAILSLGIRGKAISKLHEINRNAKNLLDQFINDIQFDENKYIVKMLKFEGLNVEINENELINLAKKHWMLIAIVVGLSWMGI